MTSNVPLEDRFTRKYEVSPAGCWEWLGTKSEAGYGYFRAGKMRIAHRWAYERFVGPIPEGLELDHLCRNSSCVNPAHLEPVTHEENQRRRFALLTHCQRGHELTPDNVVLRKRGDWTERVCRLCNQRRQVRYRRSLGQAEKKVGKTHGRSSTYATGCRCDSCREAQTLRARRYRSQKRAAS